MGYVLGVKLFTCVEQEPPNDAHHLALSRLRRTNSTTFSSPPGGIPPFAPRSFTGFQGTAPQRDTGSYKKVRPVELGSCATGRHQLGLVIDVVADGTSSVCSSG